IFAGGLLGVLILVMVMYMAGVNSYVCLFIGAGGASLIVWQTFALNGKYGEYGLMKVGAKKRHPKYIICRRPVHRHLKFTSKSRHLWEIQEKPQRWKASFHYWRWNTTASFQRMQILRLAFRYTCRSYSRWHRQSMMPYIRLGTRLSRPCRTTPLFTNRTGTSRKVMHWILHRTG